MSKIVVVRIMNVDTKEEEALQTYDLLDFLNILSTYENKAHEEMINSELDIEKECWEEEKNKTLNTWELLNEVFLKEIAKIPHQRSQKQP